tara:strand:- start:6110 stop:6496 length:387 start_codon:yes stop_codon:yes gene_type:complete
MANVLVHKHLLIRAEVKKPLVNRSRTIKFLRKLIKAIDMKAMYGPTASYCKMPGNRGVTAFAIIETSHIAMHIWDEPNPALVQLDVYSCAPLDPEKVLPFLNQMDPVKIDYKFLDRETEFKDLLVTDK